MPIHTIVKITIGNQEILKFSRLVIEQKINAHHKFSLVLPVPYELFTGAMEIAKGYVGAKIVITAKPSLFSTDSLLQFRGVVSEAKFIKADGASGGILVNGFSSTFQMDGLPDAMAFKDSSLEDIVKEIIGRYPTDRLEPIIELEDKGLLPYTVQYNESDFQFLSRLARKKGLWFYYNGRQLVFGKPKSKKLKLIYGEGLNSFSFEMRTKPVQFEYMAYDPATGQNGTTASSEVNPQLNTLNQYLFNNSKNVFTQSTSLLYNNPIKEGELSSHLEERTRTQMNAQVSDLLTISGKSDNPGIRIGDMVNIIDPGFSVNNLESGFSTPQNYGTFYITDIFHACDEAGNYYNEFQGITADAQSPPYGNVHQTAIADTQPAIVIDNNDPNGLGRVMVQFPWQQRNNATTPWIRLIQPHSGGGKGFYFIPEIGEEVLVGFEGGNPEKPYVMGAHYNGNASSGYATGDNSIKAIHTRSGHIVKFTEDESIIITDKSGNEIHLDTTGSNINITAPETMTLNARNMFINVGENLMTTVGMNNTESVGAVKTTSVAGDANLMITGKLMEMIEGDLISETKSERTTISDGKVSNQSKEEFEIHSQKQIKKNNAEYGTNH